MAKTPTPTCYRTRKQFLAVLRLNLAICQRTPKLQKFVPVVEAQLKAAGAK